MQGKKNSKDPALVLLCADMFLNRIEDTIAFGDAKIDIPMFEYCAVGVAMGNGGEEIKAKADFVTDAVAGDGLAHALRRLGLI